MPKFEFRGKTFNNPVELTIDVIGGRWKMPVLWRLSEKVLRYSELKRSLGKISHKMLAEVLRVMEKDGLIKRKIFAEVPPKVEYSLTKTGRSVLPLINKLRDWGLKFKDEYKSK